MATPRKEYEYCGIFENGTRTRYKLTRPEAEQVLTAFEEGKRVVCFRSSEWAFRIDGLVEFFKLEPMQEQLDIEQENYKENVLTIDLNQYPEEYREYVKQYWENPDNYGIGGHANEHEIG